MREACGNCGNIVWVKSYFGSTAETHNFYENVLTDIQWVNMNISTCQLVDLRAKKIVDVKCLSSLKQIFDIRIRTKNSPCYMCTSTSYNVSSGAFLIFTLMEINSLGCQLIKTYIVDVM